MKRSPAVLSFRTIQVRPKDTPPEPRGTLTDRSGRQPRALSNPAPPLGAEGGYPDVWHRASGIHLAARRCGGVADCGAGAAAGDAGDRVLGSGSPEPYAPMVAAFRQGLKETGYVEGQNVAIEYRWADGAIRPSAGDGGRAGSSSGGCDRRQYPWSAGGKGGDHDDSHCLHHRQRSGADRPRRQPEPTGRQRHGRDPH